MDRFENDIPYPMFHVPGKKKVLGLWNQEPLIHAWIRRILTN
jgi:hypothetical protein